MSRSSKVNRWAAWTACSALVLLAILAGAVLASGQWERSSAFQPNLDSAARYCAVALVGGQLYYGKLEGMAEGVIELSHVCQIARGQSPNEKNTCWRTPSSRLR